MTLHFYKYPSLVNHYAIGKERRILEKLDSTWYSTEKIHGANASVVVDRLGNWDVAKRTTLIEENDKQFNGLKPAITESVHQSITKIFSNFPDYDHLNVYGEYFGKGVQVMDYDLIKTGEKAFRVFSVFMHKKDDPAGKFTVMGLDDLREYFIEADLVPVEATATLRELIAAEPKEESNLGGSREGNVYQPVESYEIFPEDGQRFIAVKHKCASFAEKNGSPMKAKKSAPALGLEELEIREELGCYITSNRLNNVLSHGEYELIPQNIGPIMLAVKEDAITEYKRETERVLTEDVPFMNLINCYSREIAAMIKNKIQQETMNAVMSGGEK